MIRLITLLTMVLLTMVSCDNKVSLDKYMVTKSEEKNFTLLDISPSILNVEETKLSPMAKKTLESFEKINVIVLKNDPKNPKQYDQELPVLEKILADNKYQELIKVGKGKDGALVKFVGKEDALDEIIFFVHKKEYGISTIRIKGNDMNPGNLMHVFEILQKSKIDVEQLKPIQNLFPKM